MYFRFILLILLSRIEEVHDVSWKKNISWSDFAVCFKKWIDVYHNKNFYFYTDTDLSCALVQQKSDNDRSLSRWTYISSQLCKTFDLCNSELHSTATAFFCLEHFSNLPTSNVSAVRPLQCIEYVEK